MLQRVMDDKKYLSLAEIHKVETRLLAHVVQFCIDNNIKYYICGGTLLGAIRHGGFIPWDDDIDIMMPRKDFEKFESMAKENKIANNIDVISLDNKTMLYPFCKVINKNFKVDKSTQSDSSEEFLWMDVFPMDGLSEDNAVNEKIYKQVKHARSIAMGLIVSDDFLKTFTKSKKKSIGKKIMRTIVREPLKSKLIRANFVKMDSISKTYDYDSSEYVGGVVWGYGPQERMKKSHIHNYSVNFEGIEVNTMSNYDEYLTNLYGDYMKLPPVEQRVCHEIKVYQVNTNGKVE